MHHLLTHSAGFEDKSYAIAADEPITIPVTSAQLEKVRPEYVRPAGNHVVYSNFGVALLGIIIEDIDGDAIDVAMKKRIFDPLAMDHTVLPNSVYAPEHTGVSAFIDGNGHMTPVPYWAINPVIAPSGAIVSTAGDMAKYMIENLSKGTLDNAILSSEGFERLHNRRLANAEDIGGIAMIFFDGEWNGMGITSHGGNWTGFHSWMSLIPEKNTGVFVSLMAQPLPKSFWQQLKGMFKKTTDKVRPYVSAGGLNSNFLAYFFGPRKIQLEEGRDYPEPDLGRLSKYNGSYRVDRRPYTNMEEVGELFSFGNQGWFDD